MSLSRHQFGGRGLYGQFHRWQTLVHKDAEIL